MDIGSWKLTEECFEDLKDIRADLPHSEHSDVGLLCAQHLEVLGFGRVLIPNCGIGLLGIQLRGAGNF